MQAPELLAMLFARGAELLLSRLPDVWSGAAQAAAWPQDPALVMHAAKVRCAYQKSVQKPGQESCTTASSW